MLAAKRLPEILRSVLHDGIDGACLMTAEGSLLSSACNDTSIVNETKLAAISSSVWAAQLQGIKYFYFFILYNYKFPRILLKDWSQYCT